MRCRVDKYTANVTSTRLEIEFDVEQKVYDALPDTTVAGESEPGITLKTAITEAIRLIADETQGGYVVCSTGQKLVVNTATKSSVEVSGETTYSVAVTFLKSTLITTADGDEDDIAAINSMANTDMFTIAVDWGETITGIYEEIGDISVKLEDVPTVQQIQNGLAKTSELPTDYAKQGSDDTISLTSVSNTLSPIAQEYTSGKQAIVDALQSYGVECSMNDSLGELASKITTFNVIKDCIFNNELNLSKPISTFELFYKQLTINKVVNKSLTNLSVVMPNTNIFTAVRYFIFENVTTVSVQNIFYNMNCKSISLPKYLGSSYALVQGLESARPLRSSLLHVYCPNAISGVLFTTGYGHSMSIKHFISGSIPVISGTTITEYTNLYDMQILKLNYNSLNLGVVKITTALSTSSQSLLSKDEWDDPNEPTETFTCNKDKFKWYFENHFLPCFRDLVAEGSSATPTLTLYTTVYNFANTEYTIADPTKTYIDILTQRGWTVASAS